MNVPFNNTPYQGYTQPGSGYAYGQQISNNATNIIRVTSLEEAVMRTTARGSDMVYFDQDRDVFYRVKVDWDGKKSWAEFQFSLPAQVDNTPVLRNDFQALVAKVEQLEAMLKGGAVDGKSDGQNAV